MKPLLFLLAALLASPALRAQAVPAAGTARVVEGVVLDHVTADPVPRVRVSVLGDTATHTRTDAEGRFRLLVLHPSRDTLLLERYSGSPRLNYDPLKLPVAGQFRPRLRIWLAHPKTAWFTRVPNERYLKNQIIREARHARRDSSRLATTAAK